MLPVPLPPSDARAWLEIDLTKIQSNYAALQKMVTPLKVIPVLKANAYGLGMIPIAKALMDAGADSFGLAEVREAVALLDAGAQRVQVLGDVTPAEIDPALDAGVVLPLPAVVTAQEISRRAVAQNKIACCEVLIDTGMGRLGLWWEDAEKELDAILKLPALKIEGIYSHFPDANGNVELSLQQIKRLNHIRAYLQKKCDTPLHFHIANSDGLNNIPSSIEAPFSAVRAGINLYGVYDMQGRQRVEVQSVLSLKSRIIAIKELPAGTGISYGCSEVLTKKTRLGTIALGYADGLPLALSKKGIVMVHGKACRVIGRVTMDYTIIDLSPVPETKVGDMAECLGSEITVDDWARLKNTHEYEIICSLGSRVERVYL